MKAESTINQMVEQSMLLTDLLNVIRGLSFDTCYKESDAVEDLWKIVEDYTLEFRHHMAD